MVPHVTQVLERSAAGREQVTQRQLGELEVGVVAYQAFGLGQRLARAALAGELEHLQQPLLGLPIAQGRQGWRRCRLACLGRRTGSGFFGALGEGGHGNQQ